MKNCIHTPQIKAPWPGACCREMLGEMLLCIIALLLTIVHIVYRGVIFGLHKSLRLLLQLVCALLLGTLFILVYLVLTGAYFAIGSGFNSSLP